MNFSNLLKNNEDIIDQEARRTMEKLENCVIKVDFWPDLHEICDCYGSQLLIIHTQWRYQNLCSG